MLSVCPSGRSAGPWVNDLGFHNDASIFDVLSLRNLGASEAIRFTELLASSPSYQHVAGMWRLFAGAHAAEADAPAFCRFDGMRYGLCHRKLLGEAL